MSQQPLHRVVHTGEVAIHLMDRPGGSPPLLLIHGTNGNHRAWDLFAGCFGESHRMLAVDLRGRGLSDKPPAGNYGLRRHADDMAAVIRKLDLGPVVLVGASFGTYVSVVLAGAHPDLVRSLVLVDGGSREPTLTEAVYRQQAPALIGRLRRRFASMDEFMREWDAMRPGGDIDAACWHSMGRADAEQRSDGSVGSAFSEAVLEEDLREVWGWEVARHAPRVQAPALVLWAPLGIVDSRQPLFSRQGLEELVRLLPHGRLHPVDGANHMTMLLSRELCQRAADAARSFVCSGA